MVRQSCGQYRSEILLSGYTALSQWLANIISDLPDMLTTNWPLNALHFYKCNEDTGMV